MSNIIKLVNENISELTFDHYPTIEEIQNIKLCYPNLIKITFTNCVIEDFSSLQIFNYPSLCFINCKIIDQSKSISLKCGKLEFIDTVIDYRKLFFMTNMPNLKDISLFYDSLEGILLYKPYLSLLRFFPYIKRIKILCNVPSGKLFYDLNHQKLFAEDAFGGSNFSILYEANLENSFDFINSMPYLNLKGFDGITSVVSPDKVSDFLHSRTTLKKLWINPKYLSYYNNFQHHNELEIKKVLKQCSKMSREYKERLGQEFLQYDYEKADYSHIDLLKTIKENLRVARLNVSTKIENEEPEYSDLYGLFGFRLYRTNGHYIIVNHLENIISDKHIDLKTKKLEDNLLPF